MKTSRLIPFLIIPLLFACFPKKPEIPMTEVPPDALVKALERQVKSFSSLRALAEMHAARKNRKRSFESVAVLVEGQNRFRIEAFGPFGQSIAMLLWNGTDMLVDLSGERRIFSSGNALLERALGADVDPSELCAILSGSIPEAAAAYDARMFCAPDGSCVLELRSGETLVRVRESAGWESGPFIVPSWEMYRKGKFVYRVSNEFSDAGAGSRVPGRIRIENPGRGMSLTMRYIESETDVRIDERLFMIPVVEGIER